MHKELEGDRVRTAGPGWTKGCLTPEGVVLNNKSLACVFFHFYILLNCPYLYPQVLALFSFFLPSQCGGGVSKQLCGVKLLGGNQNSVAERLSRCLPIPVGDTALFYRARGYPRFPSLYSLLPSEMTFSPKMIRYCQAPLHMWSPEMVTLLYVSCCCFIEDFISLSAKGRFLQR